MLSYSKKIRLMRKNIPKSFKLFATEIKVVWDNKYCNDKQLYGEADYGASQITLSETNGITPLSDGKIVDTFYHEKVHIILDTMMERELSKNEKFVDQFAKLLRQADETAKYPLCCHEIKYKCE
jgi:hypothetical protein